MAGEKNDRDNATLDDERPRARDLTLIQEPIPQPGPGEVRVRVNAVALNYRDKMVIEGTMPIPLSFPFTPASDMAGVVDSIGEGVTRFQPGPRHLNLLSGVDRR
jgi:NADPH:quinone reductase-like Zn-dependent oxidoreductase